jgi:hypothetical protein
MTAPKIKGGTMPADNGKKTFDNVPSASIRRFSRPLDWGAVLADLEAKRAALDRAITSLRAVAASGVLVGSVMDDAIPSMGDAVPIGPHGGEVPVGAFLGKSIPEAAKLCLQITKRKMKTREIVDALLKGGIETTAKTSFPSIVHSILMRSVRSGSGIVKLDQAHWGLAEWYPASLRGAASSKRPSGKRRQKAPARKSKTMATETVKNENTPPASGGSTVPQKIWEAIRGKEMSPTEVAGEIGIKANVAAMLLAGMISKKWAEKTANGKYRAVNATA